MRLVSNWKGCGVRGVRHLVWVLGVVIGVLAVTGTAGAAATPAAHFWACDVPWWSDLGGDV